MQRVMWVHTGPGVSLEINCGAEEVVGLGRGTGYGTQARSCRL